MQISDYRVQTEEEEEAEEQGYKEISVTELIEFPYYFDYVILYIRM